MTRYNKILLFFFSITETQEEDNRVSEEDRVVTIRPAQEETTTETPVLHNPCAGMLC